MHHNCEKEMVYLISYDINEQVYDYSELKERIKSLGNFQHPMNNLWFVNTSRHSADDIYDALKDFLHDRDHLFVISVAYDADRQGWMPRSFWKWYRSNTND